MEQDRKHLLWIFILVLFSSIFMRAGADVAFADDDYEAQKTTLKEVTAAITIVTENRHITTTVPMESVTDGDVYDDSNVVTLTVEPTNAERGNKHSDTQHENEEDKEETRKASNLKKKKLPAKILITPTLSTIDQIKNLMKSDSRDNTKSLILICSIMALGFLLLCAVLLYIARGISSLRKCETDAAIRAEEGFA